VPFSLGVVKKEQHDKLLLGLLCGVASVPFGCFAAGLVCRLPIGVLLVDLLPLVLLAILIGTGLWFRPDLCVKIFRVLAVVIKAVITVGLMLGAAECLLGVTVIEGLAPIEDAALVCFRISLTLCGVFPLVHLLSRLLKKPLQLLGKRIGINEVSVLGLVANLASNSTVFGTMDQMDDKGAVMNSAFAASAAFVFGSHLAFTQARGAEYLGAMMVAKFVAGALALAVSMLLYANMQRRAKKGE
jgi:ethanolamine transporter